MHRLPTPFRGPANALTAAALLLALLAPARARAQVAAADQAPPAPAAGSGPTAAQVGDGGSAPAASGSAVVKMNPFEVQATSKDIGYYTQNTLAGTRLNSNLGDLGASITVVTKQQMEDTSSVNLNDMFLYEASTEGTENYSAYGGFDKSGTAVDSIQTSPQTANRIRGLGAADVSRDFFIASPAIQTDMYNVDSVEIARGPNSTLFGIGSPAGIVNQTIQQAVLNQDKNQVSVRVGSFGNFRSSLNLNRALIADKLSIAVAGLYQDNHPTGQKPEYDIQRREFAAFTLKPLPNTTIRGNIEYYDNPNRRANAYTPKDEITPWLAAGSPRWDPITYTATANGVTSAPITNNTLLPAGLAASIGNYSFADPTMYIVHGQVQLWETQQLGTNFNAEGTPTTPVSATNPFGPIGNERMQGSGGNYVKYASLAPAGQVTYPLFHEPGINNPRLLNWQGVNTISSNVGEDKATIYNVEVEQVLPANLFLEAGWYREQFDSTQHNYLSGNVGPVAIIDPNSRLLDGSPNPYFGRPYVDLVAPQDADVPSLNEQERLSLAYQLDFTKNANWTKWLGRHNALVFYQHREYDTAIIRYIYNVVDAHTWANPANLATASLGGAQGGTERKMYLSDSGSAISYDPGLFTNPSTLTFPITWYNTAVNGGTWTSEKATLAKIIYTASSKSQQQTWSYSGGLQDYLFKDHLVLTFGQRHDYNRNRVSTTLPVDPATGLTDTNNLGVFTPWSNTSGITRTAGGVLHMTKWLSVHYNQSDNFQPLGLAEDLFGNVLPNPTGHGKDYGVALSLFDDKLVAELNWYKSDASNQRSVTTWVDRAQRVDFSMFIPWAQEIATNTLGPAATQAAYNAFAAGIIKQPVAAGSSFPGPNFEGDTQSVTAKGWELNLIYNPLRNWNIKFTADKDESTLSNVEPHLAAWLAARLPVWQAATDPVLGPFWTTVSAGNIPTGAGSSAQSFLNSLVYAAGFSTLLAQQGHVQSDLSKYHFNLITNYLFTTGRMKGFGVGGGLRYETPAAIGYYGAAPDAAANGAIDSLQPFNPIYGRSVLHQDLWLSYATKLPFLDDRIRMKVQLNVRDLWSGGYLDTVGVNPDGAPTVYRIIPPRQYYLTTTFDF